MNLFEHRLKKLMGGLSVRKFAEKIGAPPTTVQQYLKGRTPPSDFIVLICEHFKVDPWWLLTGEEKRGEEGYVVDPQPLYKGKPTLVDRIDQMLEDMDEEAQRDVLKYAKEKKQLAEFKRKAG